MLRLRAGAFRALEARAAPWPPGLPAAKAVDRARPHLCLTASTSEAYGFLFKLLCDPGDAVLMPSPSYPLFEYLAGLEGVTPRPYELRYDGEWHIDFASLDEALRERAATPRAIVAIHPNNPTGHYLRASELERLTELCARHDLALISDEVFYEHALGEGDQAVPPPLARRHARRLPGVLARRPLKLAGLPQLKLAWIAASGPDAVAQ